MTKHQKLFLEERLLAVEMDRLGDNSRTREHLRTALQAARAELRDARKSPDAVRLVRAQEAVYETKVLIARAVAAAR